MSQLMAKQRERETKTRKEDARKQLYSRIANPSNKYKSHPPNQASFDSLKKKKEKKESKFQETPTKSVSSLPLPPSSSPNHIQCLPSDLHPKEARGIRGESPQHRRTKAAEESAKSFGPHQLSEHLPQPTCG